MLRGKRFFVESSKVQKISFYNLIKRETKEFCLNTSIHGCKYIAQTDTSVITRFMWTFIMSLAFIFAFCLIKFAWNYNYENLTLTVSDTIFNPIWNYQFPGVTICNTNKMSLKKVTAFAELIKLPNMTLDETIHLIRHLVQLQYSFYNPDYQNDYNLLQTILDNNNISVEKAMWNVRPDCSELLRTCLWKGTLWKCSTMFEESRSSLGICCSANYFGFRNNTYNGWNPKKEEVRPKKISACGSSSGMKVIVQNKPEDYFVGETPTYGVKVLIHDTVDFPGYAAQNAIVPASSQYYINVAPILTYATDSFKALKIQDRGCIFDWERPMIIFNNYSWVNCLTECRIVLMYKFCGCVPFFLRNTKIKWLPQNKACTLRDIKCVADHKEKFINAMPELNLPFTLNKSECYCMPECEPRLYQIETSSNVLSRRSVVNERQFYAAMQVRNHSVINVFFKDLVATRNKRDVAISWYSEMALFGGLLGLCFGFSFTSGFEIVYTFTFKIFLNAIHQKTKVVPKDQLSNLKKINHTNKFPRIMTITSKNLEIKSNYKFKDDILKN